MRTILIMAGGTGGHIFPGLALAEEARRRGWNVQWLGAARQMEEKLVPANGITLHTLTVSGIRGKGIGHKLRAMWQMFGSLLRAWRLMTILEPQVVVGFGGYASAPGGLAAMLKGIPMVLHEQNAVPGTTNRLLARFAKAVGEGFQGAFPPATRAVWVGNPVRQSILALPSPEERFAARRGPLRLLIIGGSRGAAVFNAVVPEAVARVKQPLEIRHQAGDGRAKMVNDRYVSAQCPHAVHVVEFVDDMAECLGWADLVICRAGALTVAELLEAGLGAILVPYPHAIDDHQTANAKVLSARGAGILVPQAQFDAPSLASHIDALSREKCLNMAVAAYQPLEPPASQRLMACVEQILEVRS